MKLYKVPCWLRNGELFRNFSAENNLSQKIDSIDKSKIKYDSSINSIDEFMEVYNLSNYWLLDRYPLDILVYGFTNKDEVIDFLSLEKTPESKILIEDIENNTSLDKYGSIIKDEFKNKKIQKYFKIDVNDILKKKGHENIRKAFNIAKDLENIIEKKISSKINLLEYISEIFEKNGIRSQNVWEDYISNKYENMDIRGFYIGKPEDYYEILFLGTLMNTIFNRKFFDKNKIVVSCGFMPSGSSSYLFVGVEIFFDEEDEDFDDIKNNNREGLESWILSIEPNTRSIVI